jgi:hypothetical protein
VDWRPGGLGGFEAWRHWRPAGLGVLEVWRLMAYWVVLVGSFNKFQVHSSKDFVLFVCFKKIQVKSDQSKINLTGTSLRNIYW